MSQIKQRKILYVFMDALLISLLILRGLTYLTLLITGIINRLTEWDLDKQAFCRLDFY